MKNEFVLPVLNFVGLFFVIASIFVPRLMKKSNELVSSSVGLVLSAISTGVFIGGWIVYMMMK